MAGRLRRLDTIRTSALLATFHMATARPASSLFINVLEIFRDQIGAGNAWTVEEIWQALLDLRPMHFAERELWFLYGRRFSGRMPDEPLQWLSAALNDLAELGLVAPAGSPEESSGFPRWRIGESWRPPEPPSGGGNDGGGGDGRIRPAADGGDGDDGGGGLRETLGHPVLLALPQGDFDALVDGMFEEVQP